MEYLIYTSIVGVVLYIFVNKLLGYIIKQKCNACGSKNFEVEVKNDMITKKNYKQYKCIECNNRWS